MFGLPLSPYFSQFLDYIRDPPKTVDDPKIEGLVDEFASLMCNHYEDELLRRREVLLALDTIFTYGIQEPGWQSIMPATISGVPGDRRTDGHALGRARTPEIIVEMKNEFGTGGDPEIQLTAYYTQLLYGNLVPEFSNL